jgi:hypothetical protein
MEGGGGQKNAMEGWWVMRRSLPLLGAPQTSQNETGGIKPSWAPFIIVNKGIPFNQGEPLPVQGVRI